MLIYAALVQKKRAALFNFFCLFATRVQEGHDEPRAP
jgi:hypothetical protein